jgi:predicted phosphodiesterase
VRGAGFLACFLLLAAIGILGFWLALYWRSEIFPGINSDLIVDQAPAAHQRPVLSDDELADQFGIRVTQVAITGGGYVKLCFLVIDPDKADAIHDKANPPAIVDETTGVVVDRVLMGHYHIESFQAGVTNNMLFVNPGNLVQPGDKVSVLLGNAELVHVDVR